MRWWRRVPAPSARTRVLGWFMLIVAIALGLNIVVVNQFLRNHVRSNADTELQHEIVKIREFASRGVDPTTGEKVKDPEQLVHSYLRDAVPDEDEALFEVVEGQAKHRSRNQVPERLDRRSDVIRQAETAKRPQTHTIRTKTGTVVYGVVPVKAENAKPRTALVIVEFLAPAQAEATQVVHIISVASIAALVVAGAISWFVAGRILAPLRQVRRTAESISESDLTRRIDIKPNSRDDVARLATTFNRMLDRLERAFQTQRAFLDDAAHELRTPLTVMRGHLELMGDDPQERAETTQLVLEEIGRMNRIVNDLLMLAAAERPDFLNPTDTDLADLVIAAVGRASALADRNWTICETTPARVWADEQRLIQALVQLASNAVRFTGAGDTISIGSAVREGMATLTVTDTGTGVDDDLKQTIFDRFSRGAQRSDDGAGLGLAIVSSIAAAHHGRVTVTDSPGTGATFVISFPVREQRTIEPEPEAGRQEPR